MLTYPLSISAFLHNSLTYIHITQLILQIVLIYMFRENKKALKDNFPLALFLKLH